MSKTILEVLVGSTVHGTAVKDGLEDLDIMAVVIEDMKEFAGFNPVDTWTKRTKPQGVRSEAGDTDYCAYGLKKFLKLALAGNPSILLALFVPSEFTRVKTTEGWNLKSLASFIVSKAAYVPFCGYMRQQHERLLGLRGQRNVTRPELVEAYGYDTKYAGHIVRLGIQGSELLTDGKITLPMKFADRELITNIRNGVYTLAEISDLIQRAEIKLKEAFLQSPLPDKPHADFIQDWMIRMYLEYWKENETER